MNGLFDLDRTMAPKLIKILYIIAVILVALGMVRGVVMGVRIMTHPPQRHDRAAGIVPPGADAAAQANAAATPATPADAGAAPPAPDATAPTAPPQAGRPDRAGRRGFGRGQGQRQFAMRGRGFGMHRRGMMGGMMMRRLGPTGAGILRIVAALLRGVILIMILRVLSEIGRSVISANERLGRIEAK